MSPFPTLTWIQDVGVKATPGMFSTLSPTPTGMHSSGGVHPIQALYHRLYQQYPWEADFSANRLKLLPP